ncbi:MAG TPA: cbb3-type cytochrome c oxidase subunit I [Noviherbaspirillum sp.]
MEFALQEHHDGRRLVGGWLLLALAALALSTLCAVLLVAARAPLPGSLPSAGELFSRALVLHVTFAVVIWFLSCAAGFWTLASGATAGTWRWTALGLSGAGLVAMVVPLFSAAAKPVLANYVPVLEHPVFLAGLVLFVAGVSASGAMSLGGILRRLKTGEAWRTGAVLSMLAAALALGALLASLAQVGLPSTPGAFEAVAWAPGHVLQFVHVLILMSVWAVLGERVTGAAIAPRSWLIALLLLGFAPALAAPVIFASHPVGGLEFNRAFTLLMAWGAWPAAVLLAGQVLHRMWRARQAAKASPDTVALLLSILLFLIGCVLGAMIRSQSTMIPAHYHGTVGAVTLAYMALGYRLLPMFGASAGAGAMVRRQPAMYGAGLVILALALAWSGWLGVPRKTLHADVITEYPAYLAAMGLVALGGLLAIAGAALYVVNIARSLQAIARASSARRDVRVPAVVLTVALTIATGLLFAYWPTDMGTVASDKPNDLEAHVKSKRKEEIDREFAEGVRLLRAREYAAAASALHRVLELSPQMPEAHVNMGFAMIGLGKHVAARDFFEGAISLRTSQMNAYYGLAVALEGIGDLEGALGAMRTYVHRSRPDDPFVRKANSAIWEWQEQLAKARAEHQKTSPPAGVFPESGKAGMMDPNSEKKIN